MTDAAEFTVKFWGTRGSIACPGPETVRFGGNTTCFEIRVGGRLLIIDGGTGLRPLGKVLAQERPEEVDLFFTHTHFDHVCGVPFFAPAYMKGTRLRFHAGHLLPETTLKDTLCNLMIAPLFPVPIHVFTECQFQDFRVGTEVRPAPGVRLTTCPLNHPNGACGYRIDHAGRSVCIITDTEHVEGELDRRIVEFVRDADVMIYDAMFTDTEYRHHVGWGHSTWQQALKVADAARVGQVVLFHHSPDHDDRAMAAIEREAAAARPNTIAAREGMVLVPGEIAEPADP